MIREFQHLLIRQRGTHTALPSALRRRVQQTKTGRAQCKQLSPDKGKTCVLGRGAHALPCEGSRRGGARTALRGRGQHRQQAVLGAINNATVPGEGGARTALRGRGQHRQQAALGAINNAGVPGEGGARTALRGRGQHRQQAALGAINNAGVPGEGGARTALRGRGQHRQQAALDEAAARGVAALQVPLEAVVLQLRHHQRQDWLRRPVLAHQARRLACARGRRGSGAVSPKPCADARLIATRDATPSVSAHVLERQMINALIMGSSLPGTPQAVSALMFWNGR